jgi:hypothetical protein
MSPVASHQEEIDSAAAPHWQIAVQGWCGGVRPDAPTHIQLAHQAKVRRLRLNPLSEDGGDAQARLVSPLLCYPFKGGNDERESLVQAFRPGAESGGCPSSVSALRTAEQ